MVIPKNPAQNVIIHRKFNEKNLLLFVVVVVSLGVGGSGRKLFTLTFEYALKKFYTHTQTQFPTRVTLNSGVLRVHLISFKI